MRNMIYSQERILILNTGLSDFLEDKNMKETGGESRAVCIRREIRSEKLLQCASEKYNESIWD